MRPAPRSRAQRRADTLALLRTEVDCWVASADEVGNAHLVPLSYCWDGAALVLATQRSSPTATNLCAWREANELSGRLLMRDGVWLPLDP